MESIVESAIVESAVEFFIVLSESILVFLLIYFSLRKDIPRKFGKAMILLYQD